MGEPGATIFANGSVFTGLRSTPWVEAVGIRGDAIVAVGTSDEVRATVPDADEIDLAGGTCLPGFVDAHNHFLSTGESLDSLDLRYPGIASAAALLDVVREAAAGEPPGRTVSGFGFDDARYALPSLAELDEASQGHPLQLFHTSGHHVLVNSVVLEAAGIGADTPDPPGGRFVRDATGRPTGLCLDAACGAVVPADVDIGSHGPNFHTRAPLDDLVAAVARADRAYAAAGLTCVADAQVTSRELGAYRAARERGVLRLRTVCMPLSHQLEDRAALGLDEPPGDATLSIGHLKVYADGTLTGGSAAFSAEVEAPGQHASYFHEPPELVALIERAWVAGWRVAVHAQGDEAIGYVLDGFERGARAAPRDDPRPRIEHAGFPGERGIARMCAAGVTAVNQPSYLFDHGDTYLTSLGTHAHELQPWRAELDAGVRVVVSSDSDVSSFRPLTTIANAMRRRTRDGVVLGPHHRLTLDEALFAHTADAAWAVGLEHRVGSLAPGNLADLTVLGADLRALGADDIEEVPVRATFVGGVAVHGEPAG